MRRLVAALLAALLESAPVSAQPVTSEILVHTTLTAGLPHHEAKSVWDDMRAGDRLTLVREPDNPHDPNAVRVEWKGVMLGYLPREDNEPIARQLDRGNPLTARIARLDRARNHRLKLQIDVLLRM
jgi:hypothetical protein